jgi:hypothetical protein
MPTLKAAAPQCADTTARPNHQTRKGTGSMAEDEHNEHHDRRRLTAREINSLADRTLSRALSTLLNMPTTIRSDMLLCVGCLRVLASLFPAGVEIDVWKLPN